MITSVIVKLDHTLGECNVETVADMVNNQVGFEVILLDSKLYPLIANDSRAVFEKIVGKSPVEAIDEDVVIIEPQTRVDPDDTDALERTVTNPIPEKLEEVKSAVSCVHQKLVFMNDLKKGFECVICRLPSKCPVVASCCQHVVGCSACVNRWRETHSRCPLCSITSTPSVFFSLKGITGLFRVGDDREAMTTEVETAATSDDSSNEFEELPTFCTNHEP